LWIRKVEKWGWCFMAKSLMLKGGLPICHLNLRPVVYMTSQLSLRKEFASFNFLQGLLAEYLSVIQERQKIVGL
jgi:hypothetical protein